MGHEFEPLSARIMEAAIAVHKAFGPGFLESIDHAALRVALSRSGIPYENKKGVCIYFEGIEVGIHQLDLSTALRMRSNRSRKHESTKTRKWPRWRRSLVRGGFLSSSIETPSSEPRSIDVNRYSKNKLRLYVDRRFLGIAPPARGPFPKSGVCRWPLTAKTR